MKMVDTQKKYTEGIFVKELKNRFLCEVLIDGISTVCYVPSSCHLSNFLELKNQKVLLVPTETTNSRTKFALFAVPFKRNYLILNTSMANSAIVNNLHNRRFSYLGKRKIIFTERKIGEYKADIYIQSSNTIIEIKSIISTQDKGIFPTVYSERTLKQLDQIKILLDKGYKVCFIIVSLNPYLKSIEIDKNSNFYCKFIECMSVGMVVKAYSCKLCNNELMINSCVPIIY